MKKPGNLGYNKILFNKSLRFQLTFAFIGLAVAPLLILGLVLSWQSYNVQQGLMIRLESQLAKRISSNVDDYIRELEDELWALDAASQLSSLPASQQQTALSRMIAREDGFADIMIVDANGKEKVHYSRLRGATNDLEDQSRQVEFTHPTNTGTSHYSPIRFDDILGEPLMTVSIPTLDINNKPNGVLIANIRLKKVWDLIANTQVGKGERVYIVDAGGKIVAHRDPSVVFKETILKIPSADGPRTGLDNKNVILAKSQIKLDDQVLYAIAEVDFDQAFSLTYNTIAIIASLVIVACLLAGLFVLFMLKRIIRPIESLEKAARAISQGDLGRRARVYSEDEIGQLATSFNQTAQKLKEMYEQMEDKVKEQTAELSVKVKELAEANSSLINNKKAMINLLEDAQELETQLSEEKAGIEKKVEERTKELANAKANLSASIDNLPLGFLMTDIGENIVVTNLIARKVVGGQDEEQQLNNLKQVLKKKVDLESYIKNCNEEKKRLTFDDIEIKGRYYQFLLSPILVKEEDNACIGIVVLIQDITEAKILNRSKDEFFSIASHELRTPLTAIRGNTSLMLDFYADALKDPTLHEIVDDIHESSRRLIDIVNDFLDTSRLEQGRVTYEIKKVNVSRTIEKIVYEMSASAQQKGVNLIIDNSIGKTSHLPEVSADEARLKQIIYNLVGNALKYTPSGGHITIDAEVLKDQVSISVSDDGQGIAPKMQPLLFHKFQQAGESLLTRDGSKGTGLGLYISKLLAEGMGGSLYLKNSELGQGSTFTLKLPLAVSINSKQIKQSVKVDVKSGMSVNK